MCRAELSSQALRHLKQGRERVLSMPQSEIWITLITPIVSLVGTMISVIGGLFFIWRQLKSQAETTKHMVRLYEAQETRLQPVIDHIYHGIYQKLKDDPSWAETALEKASLGEFSGTIFGKRIEEYKEEKKFIADRFIPILWKRIRYLIDKKKYHVYIFIDSGSTLFHLFRYIGRQITNSYDANEDWIKNRKMLTIITNNVPGITDLMRTARPHGMSPYSHVNTQCMLLPGETLPAYWAVTGKETIEAIEEYANKAKQQRPAVIISITTGNWIRVRRSAPACPNPIAFGDGHVDVKNKLIEVSNEIYVLSPLGKIFYNKPRKELIEGLELCKRDDERAAGPFEEVWIDDQKAHNVKLVSTSREPNRCLHGRSVAIKENLSISVAKAAPGLVAPPVTDFKEGEDDKSFIEADIGRTPHAIFLFDQLPDSKGKEKDIEYPNPCILSSQFRDKVYTRKP